MPVESDAERLGHASKDLYEAIERGEYPQWELNVQIMSDGEHPELDFDPLDDTKIWPEEQFPYLPVGMMTLNRNITDHHNENEQIAFGTGVLVDGIDFSDDKMLVGRTFSYSDTQPEYRPFVSGQIMKAPIERQNNYAQAGRRYREMTDWERDDLILNLVTNLTQCDKHIQEKMVWHFSQCDEDYGRRVAEGLGISVNA